MLLKDNKAAYRVVIKGIIADSENRILFVRERSDTWDLPGGGLEHGEEVKRALEREFQEELGVSVAIESNEAIIIPTWNTKFDDPVLIIGYTAKTFGRMHTTDDVSEYRYLSREAARNERFDSTLTESIIDRLYQ